MTGDTIINGTDIYTTYGAFISLDGYNGVVGWPASKPVEYNDWMEEDGIEVDLSALKLDSREFEVSFGIQRPDVSDVHTFYAFLCSEPTMTCSFNTLGLTNKTYRVLGMSSVDYFFTFGEVRVRLADDAPMKGYEYLAPSVTNPLPNSPFKLESTRFSDYGVRTLYGTLGSVAQRGSIKQFLLRNISTIDGSLYDPNPKLWNGSEWTQAQTHGTPKHQPIEVQLKCALTAPTTAEFWRNYNAFLHDLISPDNTKAALKKCEKTLSLDHDLLYCYYEGQSVEDVALWSDKIMTQFTVSMLVMSGLSEELIRFLAAESGILVITEDGNLIRV